MTFEVSLKFMHEVGANGATGETVVSRTLSAVSSLAALNTVKKIAAESFKLTEEPKWVHIYRKDEA